MNKNLLFSKEFSFEVDSASIILAHFDDEFCMYPFISWLSKKNVLNIFYLTRDNCKNLHNKRKSQSVNILEDICINKPIIHDLGLMFDIRDQTLVDNMNKPYLYIKEKLGQNYLIATMAWEGGHPDHEAAYCIGSKLATDSARLISFPAYNLRKNKIPINFCVMKSINDRKSNFLEIEVYGWGPIKGLFFFLLTFRYPGQLVTFLGLSYGVFIRYVLTRKIFLLVGNNINIPSNTRTLMGHRYNVEENSFYKKIERFKSNEL